MIDLPIACELSPAEFAARKEGLLPGLLQQAENIDWTAQGVRVKFRPSSELLRTVVQVIDAERQCCRFLRFQLTIEPDLGEMSLEISGPEGTTGFLRELIDGG